MSGKYLLDTNIVIALFANDPAVVGKIGQCVSLRREKGMRRRSGHEAKSRRCRRSPAPATSLRKQRHKRQKTGQAGYRGRTEKIERLRDGLAAVLAEHSTDGRRVFFDREGGEVRPKRPVAGKVGPGMTIR